MSSRKKLTISLVAVALVVVAAIVAVVGVLAYTSQKVSSTFSVAYTAGKNVIADVSAKYDQKAPATTTKPSSLSKTLTTASFTSADTTEKSKEMGGTSITYSAASSAVIFEFTFTNKGQSGFRASLSVDITGDNLTAEYWNGTKMTPVTTSTYVDVAGKTYGGNNVTQTMYVQVRVADLDWDVSSGASFKINWSLDTTKFGT